jgi:cobaltochelatase CobT
MKRRILTGALPIVAKALGDRYQVQVAIGGSQAHTDGDTIYLPALPADDQDAAVLAYGYLDHEAAHVRFTDWDAMGALTTPLHHALWNVFEDVRIEREMVRRFPGCRSNLDRLIRKLVADGDFASPGQGTHPAQVVQSYLLHRLRADVLGQQAMASLADATDAVFRAVVPAGAATKLTALMYEVTDLPCTADAVALAKRVLEMLEEEREEQDPPPSAGDGGGEGSEPDQDEGAGMDPDVPAPADSAGGDAASGPDGGDGSGADGEPDGGEVLKRILGASSGDLDEDLGQRVARKLQGEVAHRPGGIRVAGTQAPPPAKGDPQRRVGDVRRETNALRTRLAALIQAAKLDRPHTSRTGRRIDRRRLHRVAVGDSRVFQARRERRAVDTAVQVLLDRSGSMQGMRIQIAAHSALALGLALENVPGVDLAVGAFPASGDRVMPLTAFGERCARTAGRYGLGVYGGTPMAEAMWWGAVELLRSQKPRKLLVVVTDGEPNNAQAVRDFIQRATAEGIECLAVGIVADYVERLFPKAVVIQALEALPAAVFGLLQDRLVEAAA